MKNFMTAVIIEVKFVAHDFFLVQFLFFLVHALRENFMLFQM